MRFEYVFAACLMSLPVSSMAQDSLGHLLTTPQERLLIANRKQLQEQKPDKSPPQERIMRFDGVARRAGAGLDVWINGRLIDNQQQLRQMGVVEVSHHGQPKLVLLAADGAVYTLRPGQAFDRQQQRVLDSWQIAAELLAEHVDVGKKAAGGEK